MADSQVWQQVLVQQVRQSGRLLFRLAYRILRDSEASEDVCQQAFLKAWSLRERLRDPAALQAWLMRVVVNESLQLVRARKVRLYVPPADLVQENSEISGLEKGEFRDHFQKAIAELPSQTQTVLMLRLVEGLSGNEVRNLLGCSASEVSRRLHQGMDHLRERLGAVYPNGLLR